MGRKRHTPEQIITALRSLLLVTGLRPGEALGLKWSDLDWDQHRIRVQRALRRAQWVELGRTEDGSQPSKRRCPEVHDRRPPPSPHGPSPGAPQTGGGVRSRAGASVCEWYW